MSVRIAEMGLLLEDYKTQEHHECKPQQGEEHGGFSSKHEFEPQERHGDDKYSTQDHNYEASQGDHRGDDTNTTSDRNYSSVSRHRHATQYRENDAQEHHHGDNHSKQGRHYRNKSQEPHRGHPMYAVTQDLKKNKYQDDHEQHDSPQSDVEERDGVTCKRAYKSQDEPASLPKHHHRKRYRDDAVQDAARDVKCRLLTIFREEKAVANLKEQLSSDYEDADIERFVCELKRLTRRRRNK